MSIRKLGPSFRVLMEKSAVLDIFPTVSQPTARAFVMDRSLWYFKGKKLCSPLSFKRRIWLARWSSLSSAKMCHNRMSH